jgi:hypothetical protein
MRMRTFRIFYRGKEYPHNIIIFGCALYRPTRKRETVLPIYVQDRFVTASNFRGRPESLVTGAFPLSSGLAQLEKRI